MVKARNFFAGLRRLNLQVVPATLARAADLEPERQDYGEAIARGSDAVAAGGVAVFERERAVRQCAGRRAPP